MCCCQKEKSHIVVRATGAHRGTLNNTIPKKTKRRRAAGLSEGDSKNARKFECSGPRFLKAFSKDRGPFAKATYQESLVSRHFTISHRAISPKSELESEALSVLAFHLQRGLEPASYGGHQVPGMRVELKQIRSSDYQNYSIFTFLMCTFAHACASVEYTATTPCIFAHACHFVLELKQAS